MLNYILLVDSSCNSSLEISFRIKYIEYNKLFSWE